ncbi:hypothetical protein AA313_de0207732 [Arthrobotrys entomopaga]|nr:hypothetical protein AA313_de0207732 [Arthrobotrys entomopaga]
MSTSGMTLQDEYKSEFRVNRDKHVKPPTSPPHIIAPPTTPPKHDRIVVCDRGHLYTTTWIPLISFKAIRLGNQRYQKCPIGQHWSMTERVDEGTLSPEEREEARAHHDVNIW